MKLDICISNMKAIIFMLNKLSFIINLNEDRFYAELLTTSTVNKFSIMAKGQNAKKEKKKEPVKSVKEKREAKQQKKGSKDY